MTLQNTADLRVFDHKELYITKASILNINILILTPTNDLSEEFQYSEQHFKASSIMRKMNGSYCLTFSLAVIRLKEHVLS